MCACKKCVTFDVTSCYCQHTFSKYHGESLIGILRMELRWVRVATPNGDIKSTSINPKTKYRSGALKFGLEQNFII
jgi:hypothetical protein